MTAAQQSGVPLDRALREAAGAVGRAAGSAGAVGRAAGAARETAESAAADPFDAVSGVLASIGYEPCVTADCIALRNCPFHSLAESYPALVCGMNLDLINGMLETVPAGRARLDPAPGRCCVTIHR